MVVFFIAEEGKETELWKGGVYIYIYLLYTKFNFFKMCGKIWNCGNFFKQLNDSRDLIKKRSPVKLSHL